MGSSSLDINTFESLSNEFNVPLIDVLFIALNRYGIRMNIDDKRIRFKLRMLDNQEAYYAAVCVNTYESPFYIDENQKLILYDRTIGDVYDIEEDTCDTTYFRRNKTALTLNSNMRSLCHGCTFCGTYNLDPEDRVDMSTPQKIEEFINNFLDRNNKKDLSDLLRVTVCTGCFKDETSLVEHLVTVYESLSRYGFDKRVRYIGSQIRSNEAMDYLKENIPYFSLSLTVECFSDREKRMRREKASLDMGRIKEILENSLNHGFSTNYLYIVGLDELSEMKSGISQLANCINRMPIYQIMQNYVAEHENQRVESAKSLDYYLTARKIIEDQYKGTSLRPRSWENYRSLFYTRFQDEPYNCIRI